MNEPFSDYFKIGIVHMMAYPECVNDETRIPDTLGGIAADPFFEVIEIGPIQDDAVKTLVRDMLAESNMEPYFAAQSILLGGGLDLNHSDTLERQRAVHAAMRAVDEAADMGCRAAGVLSGKVTDDKTAAKERLIDSLKQLCAYAASRNVRIVLESFDQVDYGKNCLIGPTADAVAVSKAVRQDAPGFGLLLDLSHLPLLQETPAQALIMAGDHLVHAHIGNCAMDDPSHPAYGDNHPRFGAPGTRVDTPQIAEFLRALLDIGYATKEKRGVVSFEVKPMAGESSDEILSESKRKFEEAWQRILYP